MVLGGLVVGLTLFGVAAALPAGPPAGPGSAPTATAVPAAAPVSSGPVTPVVAAPVPAAASTTRPTEPERRSFTMAFTGDVLIHGGVRSAAASHGAGSGREFDFRPVLEPIRPIIEGVDWAVCHLEVNLAADNQGLSGYPRFKAPRELAGDLADVGYDACSTASNHSLDYGASGAVETIDVMEEAGLRHTGTARTAEEEWSSRWFRIAGTSVAHLSYAYGFNGLAVPPEAPWTVRQIEAAMILDDAARAREEGADLVVVSLHWGAEYQHEPDPLQERLAPELIGSPNIDLLIGHHAHVVQRIDLIGGEWVVYGLGNLVSNQTGLARRDELLVMAAVEERPDGGFGVAALHAVPLHLDTDTMTVYPSGPALRPGDVADDLAAQLDASYRRVQEVLETGTGSARLDVLE
jgi:hypothetical protein